jgi:hypothetical protein
VSANLEAPDAETWLKLQPLPFPRKGIARNRFAVADAAIVEVGCYCGKGDFSEWCWYCDRFIITHAKGLGFTRY